MSRPGTRCPLPPAQGLASRPLDRRQAIAHLGVALGAAALPPRTAWALSPGARVQVRLLHSFKLGGQAQHGGARPQAGLIRASDGYLYGTTNRGGRDGVGTIYRMIDAHTVQTVHTFKWEGGGPTYPTTPLLQASDGMLYGASTSGGDVGWGTIYRLKPDRGVEIMHSQGPGTGHQAMAGLIQASDGHLYGVMRSGGAWGHGTIFRLGLAGDYEVLHDMFGPTDGALPEQPLVQGADGNLYGTASTHDFSTVFRMTLDGQFSVVRTLSNTEGRGQGQLVSADGFLYGTAIYGGIDENGTFFRLRPDGSEFKVLHAFVAPFSATGRRPSGPLMRASDGFFYCVSSPYRDVPLLMQLTAHGRARALRAFPETSGPAGTLLDFDGRALVGVTQYGGDWDDGSIYRVADAQAPRAAR
jgi:uncharacterized repeat protein (TIGR03803 family)